MRMNNPVCNLFRKDGSVTLPVTPFRTDDFPMITREIKNFLFTQVKPLFMYLILLIPGLYGKPQLKEIIDPSQGLNNPFGVTFDNQGNTFIAEYEGGRI